MSEPTYVARITAPGAAAIATVAIVGPAAWQLARDSFRSSNGKALPETADASRQWTGVFGPPPGDTVVLTVRRTGPTPWVEVHCHGGVRVVGWLMDDMRQRGAVVRPWDELLPHIAPSRLRAAALRELLDAGTARTAAILLDQFHGALDTALAAIAADLEAGRKESAEGRIGELVQWSGLGRHLVQPWKVALVGRPNAGKSSLVNGIVGFSRCVVTPAAGTTRDAVSTVIAIDGWPIELIDTAGQRPTYDLLEKTGIELAREVASRADLTIWVHDAGTPFEAAPAGSLLVLNKLDLAPDAPRPPDAFATSAIGGDGIAELLQAISRRLAPQSPTAGIALPFSGDIADRIESIANLIRLGSVTEAVAELRSLQAGDDSSENLLLSPSPSHTFGKNATGA